MEVLYWAPGFRWRPEQIDKCLISILKHRGQETAVTFGLTKRKWCSLLAVMFVSQLCHFFSSIWSSCFCFGHCRTSNCIPFIVQLFPPNCIVVQLFKAGHLFFMLLFGI